MSLASILLLALALAMDALAVAVALGVAVKPYHLRHSLRIGIWFGLFQAAMPLAGWAVGLQFKSLPAGVERWLAGGLLCAVGVKMIWEAFRIKRIGRSRDSTSVAVLVFLSLATSLDALVAGFSLAVLRQPIVLPVLVIGATAFCMACAGVWIGNRIGHVFENRMEIAAGLILIGLAVRILVRA